MRAHTAAAAAVVVAVIGLAGCTTSTTGTALPSEPSGTTSAPESSTNTAESDTYGAPRVDTPLDVGDVLANPCSILTQAQLTGFGVRRTGEPDTDSAIATYIGPGCIWHQAEVNSSISVDWQSISKRGLSHTYRTRDQRAYFEETTVAGYPAVLNGLTDARDQGECGLTVGISDTLVFDALEQGRLDAQGACDRAEQIAAAVIQNLGGS